MTNAGIAGSDVHDIIRAAVDTRFGGRRAPHRAKMLNDNGSPYIARDTRISARQLGLNFCCTPMRHPRNEGIAKAFVNTLKRDCVDVTPPPDTVTVLGSIGGWFGNYNGSRPNSGLKMRSPRRSNSLQP